MSSRLLDPSSIPLRDTSEGNIWSTLVQVAQWVIFFICICGILLLFLPVIDISKSHKDQIEELQRKIAAERDHQRELVLETREMQTDPEFVERISRDRLNLGKPNETIVRFDPYQSEPSTDNTNIRTEDTH